MRYLGIGLICLSFSSSCGPTEFARETRAQVQQQTSQKSVNIAKNNAIWEYRSAYIVLGKRYEVGVSPDRSYALVAPIGQETFTLGAVEQAASAATGCFAQGDSFLYLIGASQGTEIPVSALAKTLGRTRVELTC